MTCVIPVVYGLSEAKEAPLPTSALIRFFGGINAFIYSSNEWVMIVILIQLIDI